MTRPLIVPAFVALAAFAAAAPPAAHPAASGPASAADLAFFERSVRPLLAERCYECHGEKKQKGGLRLDSLPGWQAGGDTGPVIVPGDPAHSLLVEAIHYTNEELQMPPKESLGAAEVAALTEWIRRGAPDPRTTAPAVSAPKIVPMTLAQARTHWSFQPITDPPPPPPLFPVSPRLPPPPLSSPPHPPIYPARLAPRKNAPQPPPQTPTPRRI